MLQRCSVCDNPALPDDHLCAECLADLQARRAQVPPYWDAQEQDIGEYRRKKWDFKPMTVDEVPAPPRSRRFPTITFMRPRPRIVISGRSAPRVKGPSAPKERLNLREGYYALTTVKRGKLVYIVHRHDCVVLVQGLHPIRYRDDLNVELPTIACGRCRPEL